MKKTLAAVALVLAGLSVLVSSAAAFEGGGRQPSEAPTIAFGEHYSAQLNNREDDANWGGYNQVAFWRLPPVSARDLVVVNWHVLPYTSRSGFPICMALAQGVDDFSWGGVYGALTGNCTESGPAFSVSGSGSAQSTITVQQTNASSSYLEFFAYSGEDNPNEFETYPYDFSVEAPRHYLGVAFSPVTALSANSVLTAAVTLTDGRPAPDGLIFNLRATWAGGGVATYAASTVAGGLSFPLALPPTAAGKNVSFVASRPLDAQYQAAATTKLTLKVAKATPKPPSACALAQRRLRSLGRQFNRVSNHAARARGAVRRGLLRRKRQLRRQLRRARGNVAANCRTP